MYPTAGLAAISLPVFRLQLFLTLVQLAVINAISVSSTPNW